MENEIVIENTFFSIKGKRILQNIFFRCRAGSITGLLGCNGCGKSTLLKILFGSLKPDSAVMRINGRPYNKRSFVSIAMLPQTDFFPSNMRVRSCLSYLTNEEKSCFPFDDQRVRSILDIKFGNLSGGEKRYIEVLYVLSLNKQFVLLDEPFSEVEPIYRDRLIQRIRGSGKNRGFVITDHDYTDILNLCTDIYVLVNGSVYRINEKKDLAGYGYLPS